MATYLATNVLAPVSGTACVGNSNYTNASGTDDKAALQAMINAVAGTGVTAVVDIPAGRTYRIGSPGDTVGITVPFGVTIRGLGGRSSSNTAQPATLVWGGDAGGTLFDVAVAGQNIPMVAFQDLTLTGRTDGTNQPSTLIKFRGTGGNLGSIDTGTYLRNVWLQQCSGDALRIEGGATNFFIENGRFDNWGGYAIYITGPSGVPKAANLTIAGNCTMANPFACNGFLFADGEGDGANSLRTIVKLYGLHPEFGSVSLNQTFSGGANPFDKRGLFRFGVNASVTDVQHHVYVNGMDLSGPFGIASFCAFQITATSTADSNMDNTRMLDLTVEASKGMSRGVTDSATNDELRLVGGRIHNNERPPQVAANIGFYHLGIGKNTNGGQVTSQINSRELRMRVPILDPCTVAQLPTDWPKAGMLGYVTDSSVSTLGASVAGGGTNKVQVMYNGSNWKVTAVIT